MHTYVGPVDRTAAKLIMPMFRETALWEGGCSQSGGALALWPRGNTLAAAPKFIKRREVMRRIGECVDGALAGGRDLPKTKHNAELG